MKKYYITTRQLKPNKEWGEWLSFGLVSNCYPNLIFMNKEDAAEKLRLMTIEAIFDEQDKMFKEYKIAEIEI